jgi:uncharacterized membrane protein YhaH (DUF805 family)
MNWYKQALLHNYANFSGRARRKEYWYFALGNLLAIVLLTVVDLSVGTYNEELEIGVFSGLYLLAVLIPSIAVGVRRLHDTGRSGWWLLLSAVPVVGALVILYFTVLDSEPGANEYGPNPKGLIRTPPEPISPG